MLEPRSDEGAGARHDLRDTAPVARLPLQTLTLADCFSHVGTQDPSIVLPYLLLQYNELVSEHLALHHAYASHADPPRERSEPVGLGMEGVPVSPPSSTNRFRLLRRRSMRSMRESGSPAHPKSPASIHSSMIPPQSPPSLHEAVANTTPLPGATEPTPDTARRDLFGPALPRMQPAARTTSEPRPASAGARSHSPTLWRKSSGSSQTSARGVDAAAPERSRHTASALSSSPQNTRTSAASATRIQSSPARNAGRVLGFQPGSPSVRRNDVRTAGPIERDPLCYASVRAVNSWVRAPHVVAVRLLVRASFPEEAPSYVVEKTHADLVQMCERVRVRAKSLYDTQTPPVAAPDADLFERNWTPWRVAERNAVVDALVLAFQRLPVWYDDLTVQFLSSNVVLDSTPPDASPTLGPCLRHACFLQKKTHAAEWEWRLCTLHPQTLATQAPGGSGAPLLVRLPHARIRRQFEDAPAARLGDTGPRCAILAVQVPGMPPLTLAIESNEECNEWLQALLQQNHEVPDPTRRLFSTPEPQRAPDVPSTPRAPGPAVTPRNDNASPPLERSASTSPVLGAEPRSRHGLTGLFRASGTPDSGNAPAQSDRRRFWHGLLGMGHSHGSPELGAHHSEAGTFGVPLVAAVQESGLAVDASGQLSPVPAVVRRCVDYLEHTRGIEEEGIYRISGSSSAVRALYECFSAMRDVDLEADGARVRSLTSDPHNLSSLLKMYLRSLPDNLCTIRLHDMTHAAELPERDERVAALAYLVTLLPAENYSLLRFLCAHFGRVNAAADKNKMNAHNLGIVLSPTLGMSTSLLLSLITEYDAIFSMSPRVDYVDRTASPESDTSARNDLFAESARERVSSLTLRSPHTAARQLFRSPDPARGAASDAPESTATPAPPHPPLAGEGRAP